MTYRLEIVSQLPGAKDSVFKQYDLGQGKVIGVDKQEPFMIRFSNDSSKRVQVRLSVDGTDVLTGEPASTSSSGEMWLVEPYAKLELKAWPETNSGGASFIFGESSKGVALNTHGDTRGVGVIAAAVFEEGHAWPKYDLKWPKYTRRNKYDWNNPLFGGTLGDSDYISFNAVMDMRGTIGSDTRSVETKSLKAAVGAGEFVKQAISKVQGLIAPFLATTLEVKYEWWDELNSKLNNYFVEPVPVAFPAEKKNIDLSGVPIQQNLNRPIYYR